MKVVILAGGFGTRISEESELRPKPMIEIGDKPLLWHIMKLYYQYNFNEFIICAGYKQHLIKEWFNNYRLFNNDITIDFSSNGDLTFETQNTENWKVTIVDTGLTTMTGGRIKRIQPYIKEESFMLTYGDGLSDINLNELLAFHQKQNKIATITGVKPNGRFGGLELSNDLVVSFREKSKQDVNWINGGFMVFEPQIFDYLTSDDCILERMPLETLSSQNQLSCYRHHGFWACMDTLNDKNRLTNLWRAHKAPWATWL